MKKTYAKKSAIKFIFALTIAFSMIACNSPATDEDDRIEDIASDFSEDIDKEPSPKELDCTGIRIESFKYFLGLKYTSKEKDLERKLGKETSTIDSDDGENVIYKYENTKNIPLMVFINKETKVVETIRIELLCFSNKFEEDKKRMDEDFNIDACQLDLFGKQPKEITQIFGSGDYDSIKDNSVEEDVRSLTYYTTDNKASITFKFYHSQDTKLSSMEVNWNFN